MTDQPRVADDRYRTRLRGWLETHRPADPGFALPQSPLAVENDAQFEYLRQWQHDLYVAGYVGAEWPLEYGGCSVWGPMAPVRAAAHWAATRSPAGNVDVPHARILPARTRSVSASTVSSIAVSGSGRWPRLPVRA